MKSAIKTTPTEHDEQCAFVRWFRLAYPTVRIMSIPNGGWRHQATAWRLKAEGSSPGVPDLFVPAWRLWIEMKRTRGGVVSEIQKEWMDYLEANGYICIMARGAEDAIVLVKNYASLAEAAHTLK